MNKQDFTVRLQGLREAQNITQKGIANAIGISERGYQYFEKLNSNVMPSAFTLIKIADFLDASIDYLSGRTGNSKAHK